MHRRWAVAGSFMGMRRAPSARFPMLPRGLAYSAPKDSCDSCCYASRAAYASMVVCRLPRFLPRFAGLWDSLGSTPRRRLVSTHAHTVPTRLQFWEVQLYRLQLKGQARAVRKNSNDLRSCVVNIAFGDSAIPREAPTSASLYRDFQLQSTL